MPWAGWARCRTGPAVQRYAAKFGKPMTARRWCRINPAPQPLFARMPLRRLRRPGAGVPLRRLGGGAQPDADLRPAAGPDRHPPRGAPGRLRDARRQARLRAGTALRTNADPGPLTQPAPGMVRRPPILLRRRPGGVDPADQQRRSKASTAVHRDSQDDSQASGRKATRMDLGGSGVTENPSKNDDPGRL